MFQWSCKLILGEIFTNFDSWIIHMDKAYLGWYVIFVFPEGVRLIRVLLCIEFTCLYLNKYT